MKTVKIDNDVYYKNAYGVRQRRFVKDQEVPEDRYKQFMKQFDPLEPVMETKMTAPPPPETVDEVPDTQVEEKGEQPVVTKDTKNETPAKKGK